MIQQNPHLSGDQRRAILRWGTKQKHFTMPSEMGMDKIAKMEAYEDYGSPFCVTDWERYKK